MNFSCISKFLGQVSKKQAKTTKLQPIGRTSQFFLSKQAGQVKTTKLQWIFHAYPNLFVVNVLNKPLDWFLVKTTIIQNIHLHKFKFRVWIHCQRVWAPCAPQARKLIESLHQLNYHWSKAFSTYIFIQVLHKHDWGIIVSDHALILIMQAGSVEFEQNLLI